MSLAVAQKAGPELAPLSRLTSFPLGMAQLAPVGLSEDWWLKHLGDVHWQLIAEAVGQKTTVFRDTKGRQLYAAFCATQVCQLGPDLARLGQQVEVRSTLWSVGRSRIQSTHRLHIQGSVVADFKLVSTFVAHMEAGVNASVRRAAPNLMPVLPPAPDRFAKEATARAKTEASRNAPAQEARHRATPIGADFNAVGLLYFPSFTRFFDETEAQITNTPLPPPVKRREIVYLSNIEQGAGLFGATAGPASLELWAAPSCNDAPHLLAQCLVERW